MSFTPVERNSEFYTSTGRFFQTLGSGILFAEVILGAISLDLAIFIIFINRLGKSDHPGFLTGYLWGRMQSDQSFFHGTDLSYMAIGSFFQSLIAGVLLSIEFATPVIAMAILGAWFATLSMIALGKAFEAYGHQLANNSGADLKNKQGFTTYSPQNNFAFEPTAPPL